MGPVITASTNVNARSKEMNTRINNSEQGNFTPRRRNSRVESTSKKNVTYKLDNKYLSPCFVELENMNIRNINKTSNTLNRIDSPNVILKREEFIDEAEGKIKPVQNAPFEPITPKAHIEFSIELKKTINELNILTSNTKKHVFEALDDMKNESEESRRYFKREKALKEIVDSEIKYVQQLEIIINFFMYPTKECNLLKIDDYNILFRNISMIYNINKELLQELNESVENISNAFSKIAPFFKIYSVYASEFKSILKLLQNARLLNPQFARFVENQETRPEIQNKLSALLITPIQRVPRYKLLLTNLYNLTKPSEESFNILSDCLTKIEEVAEHINKVLEDQENAQRLLEFQRCLRGEPNVITPGRKLIMEGILMKMSTKNAHSEKLYVVLMCDIIMFTRMKRGEPKVNSLKCLSIFPLNKCKIVEILEKGCFKVICQEEELILYHDHLSETKSWIQKIKETIDEHMRDRKTLRKESSARRPVNRKDLHEYHEVGLSPGRPLRKRRLNMDMDSTSIGPSTKILKRKPIHTIPDISENVVLSLPVDTEPTAESTVKQSSENVKENGHQESKLTKDLCVLGKPITDTGFKFNKFFGGVGSTIKRFLGFRN